MIIIYPTDTVFGLGCGLFDYNSITKIYKLKGKNFKEPLSFAVSNVKEIELYADVSAKDIDKIKELLKQGSHYTFVAKQKFKHPCIDRIAKNGKIGIRVLNTPLIQKLTEFAPIISTSANVHGEKTARRYEDLDERIIRAADIAIKGECHYGKPSIVYDLVDDRILRK
jgi:L-threonylcarbamoyladenylate synthase